MMLYLYNTTDSRTGNPILGPGLSVTFGPYATSDRIQVIAGSVWVDQPGTLFLEQSFDGQNWDYSEAHPVAVLTPGTGQGQGFLSSIIAPNTRIRYVNGGTTQGIMRMSVRPFAQSVRP